MPRRRRLSTTHQTYSASTMQRRHSPKLLDAHETQDCQVSSTTTNLVQEIQSFPLVTTLQIQQHDPELDADKRSITNHPLYPLLAKLLQQCELASVRPDSPPSPGAFDDELRAYVQHRLEPENTDLTRPNKGKDHKEYYSNHYDTAYSSSRVVRNPTAGRFKQGDSKKASRPQSTDCRIYSTDKSRDFDKSIDMVDPDYSAESGTRDPAQFDDSKKLQVFVEDSEVDELIVKAVQVLRIHLMELHKVNELCKDFCSRYIHSLKTKFQSDPMIHDSQPSSPGGSEGPSPGPVGCYPSRCFPAGVPRAAAVAAASFMRHPNGELLSPDYTHQSATSLHGEQFRAAAALATATAMADSNSASRTGYPHSTSLMNGHEVSYARGQDGSGLCYTPNCHTLDYGIPQFGTGEDDEQFEAFGQLHPFFSQYGVVAANDAALHARLDSLCVGTKQKRGVLPKRATQIMKQWLFQHLVHPYPTEDEKRLIANQTNLTLLQVNNWFINARRRILQPMLDASNFIPLGSHYCGTTAGGAERNADGLGNRATDSTSPPDIHIISKKKKAATSRPSNNRFWPASLAAAAAIHPVAAGLVSSAATTATSESSLTHSGNYITHQRAVGSSIDMREDTSKTTNPQKLTAGTLRMLPSDRMVSCLHASDVSAQMRQDASYPLVSRKQVNSNPTNNLNCWEHESQSPAYNAGDEYGVPVSGSKVSVFRQTSIHAHPSSLQQRDGSKHPPDCMDFTTLRNVQSDMPGSPDTNQTNVKCPVGKNSPGTIQGEKRVEDYDSRTYHVQNVLQHPQRHQRSSQTPNQLQPCGQTSIVPSQSTPAYDDYGSTKSSDMYVPNLKPTLRVNVSSNSQSSDRDPHAFSALTTLHASLKPDSTATASKSNQTLTTIFGNNTAALSEKATYDTRSTKTHSSEYGGGKFQPSDTTLLHHISELTFQQSSTDCVQNNTFDFHPKLSQSYPSNYSSALLNQAQQYSNYLASGIGQPGSLSSSGDIPSSLTCSGFQNVFAYSSETASPHPFSTIPHLSQLYNPPFPTGSLFSSTAVRPNHVNSIFGGLTDQSIMAIGSSSDSGCQHSDTYALPSFGLEKPHQRTPPSAGLSDAHPDAALSPQAIPSNATNCNFSSVSRSTREPFDQPNINSISHFTQPAKDPQLHRPPKPIYPPLCYYSKYIPTISGPRGAYNMPSTYLPTHYSIPP